MAVRASRSSWSFNPELIKWCDEHKDLLKFIAIDACCTKASPEEEVMKLAENEMAKQQEIMKISNFQKETLESELKKLETQVKAPKPPWDADPKAMKHFHVSRFLSEKLIRMRRKELAKVNEEANHLLELLTDVSIVPPSVSIAINFDELRQALNGSMKFFAMSEYQKVASVDLASCVPNNITEEKLRVVLNQVVDQVALQIDRKTFFFASNDKEQRFEQWLFCDSLPMREDVDNILRDFQKEPRRMFPQRIIELYAKISQYFEVGVGDAEKASCMIIMLFRVMFSRAYGENPLFFYKSEKTGLQNIGKQIPVESLEVPEEILPKHEAGENVYDVFRRDGVYRRAGRHFEYAILATNPIDAIFEIHEILMYIQNIVSARAIGGMMPFETTFGLFIGAMLASDVPNFEELAEFVCDFAPANGLCPEFEFTCTTTQAALNYCKTLREGATSR